MTQAAEVVLPVLRLAVPAAHTVQEPNPAFDHVPTGQVWQLPIAMLPVCGFAVPAEQRVQLGEPAADHDPGLHNVQALNEVLSLAPT